MRTGARYALCLAAATALCLVAFPWILRLAAPLAAASAGAAEAIFRFAFGP